MHCPRCDHENPPDSRFCLECGASLALHCARCNTNLPVGAKFCNACGTPVGGDVRAPETYTPKHLAEKILISRSALEGERKQVSILFADLKSSMELSEHLDPEEWRRVLEHFFDILTRPCTALRER